jgi:hypothetical protein
MIREAGDHNGGLYENYTQNLLCSEVVTMQIECETTVFIVKLKCNTYFTIIAMFHLKFRLNLSH